MENEIASVVLGALISIVTTYVTNKIKGKKQEKHFACILYYELCSIKNIFHSNMIGMRRKNIQK